MNVLNNKLRRGLVVVSESDRTVVTNESDEVKSLFASPEYQQIKEDDEFFKYCRHEMDDKSKWKL